MSFPGGGAKVDAGTMNLAPVGSITGQVRASDEGVTNFQNTQIYIPGSGYVAVTGPEGTFTIKNVPVGSFGLHAFNQYLGDADSLPNAVAVQSNKDSAAPPLVMAVARPELTFLTRVGTDSKTDNGGAGTVLTLHGKNFGKTKGAPFSVGLSGSTAATAKAESNELATVTLPKGATSGEVWVHVGFVDSNHLVFRLVKSFHWDTESPIGVSGECILDRRGNHPCDR